VVLPEGVLRSRSVPQNRPADGRERMTVKVYISSRLLSWTSGVRRT
jgi:hypothetical protein